MIQRGVGPRITGVFVWNYPEKMHLLKDPTGPLGQYLFKRGEAIRIAAMMHVGKNTGNLARSMKLELKTAVYGQNMIVGSPLNYAYYVHEGTRPHMIHARGGVLRFSKGGRVVYSRQVMHPGSKPQKYLSTYLPMVLL